VADVGRREEEAWVACCRSVSERLRRTNEAYLLGLSLGAPFVSEISEGSRGLKRTQNTTTRNDVCRIVLWVLLCYPKRKYEKVGLDDDGNLPCNFFRTLCSLVLAQHIHSPCPSTIFLLIIVSSYGTAIPSYGYPHVLVLRINDCCKCTSPRVAR
jgi:hypothetical protein